VRQLLLRPNDVVIIIYTSCRYIDKSNVICHWKDAIGRPQTFNYAPHLTNDIWSSVQHLIQNGFNATMIWNKFISDVEHGYGELFTWRSRDALMTRQDKLNIYNDTKRLEYVKDQYHTHFPSDNMPREVSLKKHFSFWWGEDPLQW